MTEIPRDHLGHHYVPRDFTVDLESKLTDVLRDQADLSRPIRRSIVDIRGGCSALNFSIVEFPFGRKNDYNFRFRYFPINGKIVLDFYNRMHKMKFRYVTKIGLPHITGSSRVRDIIGVMLSNESMYTGSYTVSFPEMEHVYQYTNYWKDAPSLEPAKPSLDAFGDDDLLNELIRRSQSRMPDWHERLYPRDHTTNSTRKIA